MFENKMQIIGVMISCFFVSCTTTHRLAKYNYYNGSHLYNDSINFNVAFFGDIITSELKDCKATELKKLRQIDASLKRKNLLYCGKSNVPPLYKAYLFYQKEKRLKTKDSMAQIQLLDAVKGIARSKILYKEKQLQLALVSDDTIGAPIEDLREITKKIFFDNSIRRLSYSDIFETYKEETNYLKSSKALKKASIQRTKKNNWMQFQFFTTINSFIARNKVYDSLITKFEKRRKEYLQPIMDSLRYIYAVDSDTLVLSKIARDAEKTRVTMLNENHWYPKHRVLAMRLLIPLKERGYTHLALETLNKNQDTLINQRGYPTLRSGYYTREPYFAQFVRKARSLGFTIVGYESQNREVNREREQARNITKILDEDPKSKVFVYAGLAHIIESSNGQNKRMAGYLKDLTSIDPLTINQSELVMDISKELEIYDSSLFKNSEKINKGVDYFVVNAISPNLAELYKCDKMREVLIKPVNKSPKQCEKVMVSVYNYEEYKKYKSSSIPITNVWFKIKEKKIKLLLPPGNFYVTVRSCDNDVLYTENLNIH